MQQGLRVVRRLRAAQQAQHTCLWSRSSHSIWHAQVLQEHPDGPDILVNNAGAAMRGPVLVCVLSVFWGVHRRVATSEVQALATRGECAVLVRDDRG
jgi:hypothetical protein